MLPDLTTVAWRAAASIFLHPQTSSRSADDVDDARLRGVSSANSIVEAGVVKSRSAIGANHGGERIRGQRHADVADAGQRRRPRQSAGCPRVRWPYRYAYVSEMTRTSVRPMRPPAPTTTSFMSDMSDLAGSKEKTVAMAAFYHARAAR